MPEIYENRAETLRFEHEADTVTEQELLALGFVPTKAWVREDFVVFVHNGNVLDVVVD